MTQHILSYSSKEFRSSWTKRKTTTIIKITCFRKCKCYSDFENLCTVNSNMVSGLIEGSSSCCVEGKSQPMDGIHTKSGEEYNSNVVRNIRI